MTAIANPEDFKALHPFFRIIEDGLRGIAESDHFFDLLAAALGVRSHALNRSSMWMYEVLRAENRRSVMARAR